MRPDGSLAHPWGHSAHPDYILVGYEWRLKPSPPKPRTEIVIDQVRELSERLALSAEHGARIAIVEPADAVNYNAWNSILKTLEEPQPGRYLWLVASNPSRLPATIRSRCQRLEMRCRRATGAGLAARAGTRRVPRSPPSTPRAPSRADAWLRDGGLALRKEVAADLAPVARGERPDRDRAAGPRTKMPRGAATPPTWHWPRPRG